MATVDVSGLGYLLPIFGFLFVFIIVYATLNKTKIIGEVKFIQLLVSFIIATVFVLTVQPKEYILSIIPGFAVMIVVAFLILVLTGFIGDGVKGMAGGIGNAIVVIMMIIFIVVAYMVFSASIDSFISGVSGLSPKILGAAVFIVISALVSWVLVKSK